MTNALPISTRIGARGAKTIGGFGLVRPVFTIAYQSFDLSLTRPGIAFTNHYHRIEGDGGLGVDQDASGWVVATWAVW